MTTVPFLSDLTRLRSRTRKHSAEGAAAASDAARRATLLQLLNDVLASELVWLMRYRRSYLLRLRKVAIGDEHAGDEPTPADRLARRIVELGGRPDLDPDDLLSRSRCPLCAAWPAGRQSSRGSAGRAPPDRGLHRGDPLSRRFGSADAIDAPGEPRPRTSARRGAFWNSSRPRNAAARPGFVAAEARAAGPRPRVSSARLPFLLILPTPSLI